MSADHQKAELREGLRAQRRQKAGDAEYALSAALSARMQFLALLEGGQLPLGPHAVIAAYYPLPDELSPLPLVSALRDRGHGIALPVTAGRAAALTFRIFAADTPLRTSSFGVAEPAAGADATPDLIIVPLLAFDRRCQRLGYGAGHYDRTLAARPVPTVGFAFDFQRIDRVPTGPHDQALDCIVTDKQVYWPREQE